jgi:hypothetical protein
VEDDDGLGFRGCCSRMGSSEAAGRDGDLEEERGRTLGRMDGARVGMEWQTTMYG